MNDKQILGYRSNGTPIYPNTPGMIVTACIIVCEDCSKIIKGMGGPCIGAKCPDCFKPAVKVERDIHGVEVNTNPNNELWESDPDCVHDIRPQPSGGVKCTKCRGWFCF